MRDSFVNTLVSLAQKDENIVLITGDLGFGVLRPYANQFPDRLINAGIAEQAMTGVAAGLAFEGKTVFTYSIGNFPTLRCLEQIRNDCAYHNLNVKIVCVGGGFTYGSLGMSHHATEDIAVMRALPGVTVVAPCGAKQSDAATKAIYNREGVCYLRLGRGGENEPDIDYSNFELGKAIKITSGVDGAIFFTGALYPEVINAQKKLEKKGVSTAIYSFPTIKPIDKDIIEKCTKKYPIIVTVEEHSIIGGFGSAVCEVASEIYGNKSKIVRIGINDTYSSIVGNQSYLKDYYGITSHNIANAIEDNINC